MTLVALKVREQSLIMTGRGVRKFSKKFKLPPVLQIETQTPSRFQRIISDSKPTLQKRTVTFQS